MHNIITNLNFLLSNVHNNDQKRVIYAICIVLVFVLILKNDVGIFLFIFNE